MKIPVISVGDKVTGTTKPTWFVAYLHNWRKRSSSARHVSENEDVIVFPWRLTDPLSCSHGSFGGSGPQVKFSSIYSPALLRYNWQNYTFCHTKCIQHTASGVSPSIQAWNAWIVLLPPFPTAHPQPSDWPDSTSGIPSLRRITATIWGQACDLHWLWLLLLICAFRSEAKAIVSSPMYPNHLC